MLLLSCFGLPMMVRFPLTSISNVFVPPDTLPAFLESVVDVNPITFLVTAMRALIHGGDVAREIGIVLAISALLVAVFGPLTVRAYRRHA